MITTNSLDAPIAANAAGIRAFWKWFGKSQVTDDAGQPLVVYHGTPSARFDRFNRREAFFTDDIDAALSYGRVMKCYLRMENPLIVDAEERNKDDIPFEGRIELLDVLVDIARRRGYDGLLVERVIDSGPHGYFEPMTVFVVHNTDTQVKAVKNRGTFDPSDPVITNPMRRRYDFSRGRRNVYARRVIPALPLAAAKGMRVLKGFRPTIQSKDWTCGPACARAVLHHFGRTKAEATLAHQAGTTRRHGTTPTAICDTLATNGVRIVPTKRANLPWCLRQLRQSRPVLLLWNDWRGHWVVLIGYDARRRVILLADPAAPRGLRVHRYRTFVSNWRTRVAGQAYRRLAVACARR